MNGGQLGTIIFPILTTQQVITAEEKQSFFVVDIQNKASTFARDFIRFVCDSYHC